MKILFYLVIVCFLLHAVFAGYTFHYGDVESWDQLYPDACDGSRQSPINIRTGDTVYQEYADFVFTGYDDAAGVTQALYNNGHTLQLTLDGNSYAVSGGGLSYTYNAAQLHFHWGSVSSQGSEHTVNQVHYAAEMHIVHVKDGLSLSEAIENSSGIAVLGFLIEVSDDDNDDFAPLIEVAEDLVGSNLDYLNTTIVLQEILPEYPNMFHRYEGSLTTPNCNEAVIWTIFKNTISLSEDQLDVLRALTDDEGHNIVDNYRPTQPLNNRVVYASYDSGSGFIAGSVMTMIFAAITTRVSI